MGYRASQSGRGMRLSGQVYTAEPGQAEKQEREEEEKTPFVLR